MAALGTGCELEALQSQPPFSLFFFPLYMRGHVTSAADPSSHQRYQDAREPGAPCTARGLPRYYAELRPARAQAAPSARRRRDLARPSWQDAPRGVR
jgi:hypothetical protein